MSDNRHCNAIIGNNEFLIAFEKHCETAIPLSRQLGRNLFFGTLALCSAITTAGVIDVYFEASEVLSSSIAFFALYGVFVSLRRMSKDWDAALRAKYLVSGGKDQ